jgi:hypothetical protein
VHPGYDLRSHWCCLLLVSETVLVMDETQTTAQALEFEVITSEIRRAEDISPAFDALNRRCTLFARTPFVNTHRIRVNTNTRDVTAAFIA